MSRRENTVVRWKSMCKGSVVAGSEEDYIERFIGEHK